MKWLRNFSSGACATRSRESALVKFPDRVFDMLAKQAPLFRCHMAVAAALIEIGRNDGAHDGLGGGPFGSACALYPKRVRAPVARRRMTGSGAFGCWLGVSAKRADRACRCAGYRKRNHLQSHVRPDPSRHLVPFIARQPATSNPCTNPVKKSGVKSFANEVSTEQPTSVKQCTQACFTPCHRPGKFCNRL
jgi:hypothetical protein